MLKTIFVIRGGHSQRKKSTAVSLLEFKNFKFHHKRDTKGEGSLEHISLEWTKCKTIRTHVINMQLHGI
jgi:hypothetical protein